MYRQSKVADNSMKSASCPKCTSTRLMLKAGKLSCTNCEHVIGRTGNKYGAKKTIANDGMRRDSKFEASVADQLLLRKQAGDIKDYDSQYRIEAWACRADGTQAFLVRHKVDFRIHHNDSSFELYEAKGVETSDYIWRRKFLEHIWLPEHPDHIYTVIKQNNYRK